MERPILMSAPMVRAILAGEKTQTRRVVKSPSTKHQDVVFVFDDINNAWWPFFSDDGESSVTDDGMEAPIECPYGRPGDRLWVREAWRTCSPYDPFSPAQIDSGAAVFWMADESKRLNGPEHWGRYRHARFMPRWASRITLEVTAVRVERLQDISEADSIAEGITHLPELLNGRWGGWNRYTIKTDNVSHNAPTAREVYEMLWGLINGPGSWELNSWVWVVEFRRVDQ